MCGALQGEDPYQYALYGPTMTITRKLARSGANTYTLAPHSGKVFTAFLPFSPPWHSHAGAVRHFCVGAMLGICNDIPMHARQAHNIKAAELHAILDHFSIDASNPVICLTQVRALTAQPSLAWCLALTEVYWSSCDAQRNS